MINENIKNYKTNKNNIFELNIKNEYFNNLMNNIKSFCCIDIPKNNLDSLIIKNRDELNSFYNLISNKINIKNIKLLYRASRDGLNFNNLKDKINNKSNLIFLFLTGNSRIFGSFTSTKIEVVHDNYIKDENAFAFSLNNNKIYEILIPEYALRFYNGNPILIGNTGNSNGFWIFSGQFKEYLLGEPKIYNFQKDDELTEGKNKFNELEIFEINYEK